MSSYVTILLEVPSYLKSYLVSLYGPGEPITFPRKSAYNAFLIARLGKPPKNYKPDCSHEGKVEIMIPWTNGFKNIEANNHLGISEAKTLRQRIREDFESDFLEFCRKKMKQGKTRKAATVLFMECYNVREEEMTFDAFYKDMYRRVKKRRAIFSNSMA